MSAERADYLDTQTLAGGEGYFHTENDPEHHARNSPETPLVAASRGEAESNPDGLDEKTNKELQALADERGIDVGKKPNKATLLEALRA